MIFTKDPQALLDYGIDLATAPRPDQPPWLAAGETLVSGTVDVPAGLVKDRPETVASTGQIMVWLSGGTPGETYHVTFHFTTNQGRADERTIPIRVRNR